MKDNNFKNSDMNDMKEKHQIEFKKIKDRLNGILRSLDDIVFVFNEDGAFTDYYSNDKNQLLLEPDKFLGKKVEEVMNPHITKQFKHAMRKNKRGIIAEFEYSAEFSGEVRYYNAKMTPQTAGGKFTGSIALVRDITQTRRSMVMLTESENMYRELLRTTPDSILVSDLQGNILDLSKKSAEMHGYDDPEELIGLNSFDLVAPEDTDRVMKNMEKTIKGEDIRFDEYRLLKKDGTSFPAEMNISLLRDDIGNPQAIIGIARDITARKKYEKELEEKTADLALLNNLYNAINRNADMQGIADVLNEGIKKIVGDPACRAVLYLISKDKKHLLLQTRMPTNDSINKLVEFLGIKLPELKVSMEERSIYKALTADNKPKIIDDKDTITAMIKEYLNSNFDSKSAIYKKIKKNLKKVSNILNIRSVMFIPLVFNGELVGLVDISASRGFSGAEFDRITKIAARVTVAIRGKHIKDELEESEAKYSTLIESAYDAVGIAQDGVWVFGNRATEKITGYKVKDMIGKPFSEIVAGESKDIVTARYRERISGGHPPSNYEIKIKTKDGKVIDVGISAVVVPYNGRPAVLSVIRDITENKQKAEELRQSEKRYRAVVEDQAELICRFLPDGRLTFVNDAYSRYFKKDKDELIGNTFIPLIPEDDRKTIKEILSSISIDNPVVTHRHRVILPEGGIAWQTWTNRAIFNEDNEIIEYQAVGRDITELINKDRELQQAQKLSAIGQLASGVAHEINNPLSALSGEIQWLMEKTEDKKLMKSLEFMNKVSTRIADIVTKLLAFSRDTSQKERVFQNLNHVVEDTLIMMERRLKDSRITVYRDYEKKLPEVYAGSGQMEQVFVNIVLNSADSMPDGGKLCVKTFSRDEKTVSVRITDNGCGIKENELNLVFDPFYSSKSADKGTGLGLTVSHGIIANYGGNIQIKSELHKGTQVTVNLPVKTG
ncbi:MAG: PAS domain S-box protein [Elusimicrobiota bacterium]